MYVAGEPARKAERLIDITHDALMEGIEQVEPGRSFGDIGAAIQRFAEANRCSVVRDFCGHGLGRVFHAAPNVLHYGRWGTGPVLEPGMFFTIEPMINLGRPETKVLDGRLDRGHQGPLALGAVRAFGRRDRDRLRDLHPLAGRALPPDLGARGLTPAAPRPRGSVPLVLAVAEQLACRGGSGEGRAGGSAPPRSASRPDGRR